MINEEFHHQILILPTNLLSGK